MNQSFLERKRPNRLAGSPPITVPATSRWLAKIPWKNNEWSSAPARQEGCPPPAFAIASPGSSEGEAMAGAGGITVCLCDRKTKYGSGIF